MAMTGDAIETQIQNSVLRTAEVFALTKRSATREFAPR